MDSSVAVALNIADAVSEMTRTIADNQPLCKISGTSGLTEDAKINLPARVRMTMLYAVAQMLPDGGRVVNTCNRSEDYVGYSTKYGDAAGDFSPLSQLLVEEVKQIGEVPGLPAELIQNPPSDGVSGLTDEDRLGFTDEELDSYLLHGVCTDEMIKKKIDWLHARNRHKLAPMPAFLLQDKAFT